MPNSLYQSYFSRGATRILFKRETDGAYYLKVNDGEPTPMEPRELADMLYDWVRMLTDAGYPVRPFNQWGY